MKTAVVILAAGKGERMNSSTPKVLHEISGRPMLQYVVDSASELQPSKIVIVVGRQHKGIKKSISDKKGIISFVAQKVAKGTGDALSKAGAMLKNFKGTILVLNGDVPLITGDTLSKFLRLHNENKNSISLISFIAANPAAYGRVIRDDSGNIMSIVEEKDATNAQKNIREVNSGIYAIETKALSLLKNITINVSKREYYLTDIVGIAKGRGCDVEAFCIGSEDEMQGVNTRAELLRAQHAYRRRLINKWMDRGVTFIEPGSVFITPEVIIGNETIIYPNVHLEGKTRLGKRCVIYPNVRIIDSVINNGAVIKDSTVIEYSLIRSNAAIGPFAHIRPGCDIGPEAKIGNFVELKKSSVGKGTKASHLSYIGDAAVGKDVNIGAGTITCNYDGKKKHRTIIEDNVFIGSDTQLVAPVRVCRGAYVGAGSTITKTVPKLSLAVSRVEQKNIKDWATKKFRVSSSKFQVSKRKRK